MGWRWLLVTALCLAPFALEGAGDAPIDRATLRGLKSVGIVLDPLDPELQKAGLTEADFRAQLDERLRSANIPVDASAPEFLGLRITAVRGAKGLLGMRGLFAVSFSLAVYQPVLLVRDKNVRSATATWEVETVLMADPKVLHQAASETVDELAGRFAAAWRSVNAQ